MELDKLKEDDQVTLRHALLITPFMSNSHRLCQLQKNKQGLITSSKTSALFRVRREETSENAVYSWILPGLEQWEWWGDVTAGTGGVHLKKHKSPALTPIWLHLSQFISLQFHSPCFQELRPLPKCWQAKWVGYFSAHMCLFIRHFSLGKKNKGTNTLPHRPADTRHGEKEKILIIFLCLVQNTVPESTNLA